MENNLPLIFSPIKAEKPYKDEIGDILSGEDYIYGKLEKSDHGNIVPLMFYNFCNPWNSAKLFQIDIQELKRVMAYECPFSGNTYYHFLPTGIRVNDISIYRKGIFENKDYSHFDMLFDLEWNKDLWKHECRDNIVISFLGHGYTDGTLPNDGSGHWDKVKVKLSNGDFLVGCCWIWFNK